MEYTFKVTVKIDTDEDEHAPLISAVKDEIEVVISDYSNYEISSINVEPIE